MSKKSNVKPFRMEEYNEIIVGGMPTFMPP
jgi:hypothetical protein